MSTSTKAQAGVWKEWRRQLADRAFLLSPLLHAATVVEDPEFRTPDGGPGTFAVEPASLTIRYNPEFAAANSSDQNCGVLAHELCHVLCDHIKRRTAMAKRDGTTFSLEAWVAAEEMSCNDLVTELFELPLPGKPYISPDASWRALSVEQKYRKLLAEGYPQGAKGSKPMAGDGSCTHGDGECEGMPGMQEVVTAAAMDAVMRQLNESMKGQPPGNMSGELRRLAIRAGIIPRPVDWRTLLRQMLTAADYRKANDFDHSTIYKRRQLIDGLVCPNLSHQPTAQRAVVSIDNSGSVDDGLFAELLGILNDAFQKLGFQQLIIQHFTTEVLATERLNDIRQLRNVGRQACGGTDITEADKLAAKERGQFHIILTDGELYWLPRYSLPTVVVVAGGGGTLPSPTPGLIGAVRMDGGQGQQAEEDD